MVERLDQQLGKYRLIRLLGTGRFAEVYLGVHTHLGREATIKLLHTKLASDREMEKFRQEARTIAALMHPNIVRVLDFDVQDGTPYLVMDYAPNGSLRQVLPQGRPLAPAEILPYLAQVAAALQYAHEQKVVHRDIKPENMLLGRHHEVLLVDFGIETVAQSTDSQKMLGVADTAAYMSPEQVQGHPRPSSDLYSLGVVAYEWLTGALPFQGTFRELGKEHLFAPPPSLREKVPTLSPEVEQVVLTALAKDPKDRFGSVRAFANAFAQATRAGATFVSLAAPGIQGNPPGMIAPAVVGQATPRLTPIPSPALSGEHKNLSGVTSPDTQHLAFSPLISGEQAGEEQAGLVLPFILDAPTRVDIFTAPTALIPDGAPAPPVVSASGAPQQAAPSVPTANAAPQQAAPPVPAAPPPPGPPPARGIHRKLPFHHVVMMALGAVVAVTLVAGGVAFGLPLLSTTHSGGPGPATSATVTVTPQSSDLKKSFNITAVPGTPDATKMQVGARVISTTTPASSQTVNATGQRTIAATKASGTLTLANMTNGVTQIFVGDTFTGTSGVTVVADQGAVPILPGATATVTAHAVNAGSAGNIPAGDINIVHNCSSGQCASIINTAAFTGGRNASIQTVVRQSDIDGAASSLIQANQPDAQQVIQGELQSNERLVGTPRCQPNTSADHNAGYVANQVTVTVTFTCTGEAYDYDGALALGAKLLKYQAASNPGTGYVLVGQIKTTLLSAIPDSQATVAIVVHAEGIWAYQFSDAQRQMLARLIAGKSKQNALSLLTAQTGVAKASIQIKGSGQKLPTKADQITVQVQAVSGL